MRLSKLEPHVVQPSDETADVRLFLQDLEEESTTVSEIQTYVGHRDEGNGSADDEVKQGFVRLVDFIAKKEKQPYYSLQAVANRAYKLQKAALGESQIDKELEEVSESEISHIKNTFEVDRACIQHKGQ